MNDMERYNDQCKFLAQGTEDEWELRLFIEAAIENYKWLNPFRKQKLKLWQYQDKENKIQTPTDLLAFLQSMLSKIEVIGRKSAECLTYEISPLFGGDEEGDAETIISSAENLMSSYQELIDLKASLKFIDAIDSYKEVVEEMGNVVESICKSYDIFYKKLVVAKSQLEDLIAGKIKGEDLHIDLNISLNVETNYLMELVQQVIK